MPPNTLAVPKKVFSCAMAVMDKLEGWNEKVGGVGIHGVY